MESILRKTDCIDHNNTYNESLVSKLMQVILNMKPMDTKSNKYKLYSNKFLSIKEKFFTAEKFKDINKWTIQYSNIYELNKFNLTIKSLTYGGAYECPYKKSKANYDGYNFGNTDFIIYNNATHQYIIINSFHIHSLYYHNYLGNEKYKINIDEACKVLTLVPNYKMIVTFKSELVYDNIYNLQHNEFAIMKSNETVAFDYDDDQITIRLTYTDSDVTKDYEILTLNTLRIKYGTILTNKPFLYLVFFNEDKMKNEIQLKQHLPENEIMFIKKNIMEKLNIKLDMKMDLYRHNMVNKCYPILRDMYYCEFIGEA